MEIKLISTDDKRFTCDIPPINKFGQPTTYLSFMVAEYLYDYRNRAFSSIEISDILALNSEDTLQVCKQFSDIGIFIEKSSGEYQYNLRCEEVDLQNGLESFFIEANQDETCIKSLDYSPSVRY